MTRPLNPSEKSQLRAMIARTDGQEVLATVRSMVVEQPLYYECGICEHYHPWNWNGDCRDNSNRFTAQQLDDKHGEYKWEERTMDERVEADRT